jgi:hypothetical protein
MTATDAGMSSNAEIRIMMPTENPRPAAIARAFSRNAIARATPRQVVKQERRESRRTAVVVVLMLYERLN